MNYMSNEPRGDRNRPTASTDTVFSQPPIGPGSAIPISETLRNLYESYKRVLLQHSVAAFEAELPAANWKSFWVGAGILGLAWSIAVMALGLFETGGELSGGSLLGGVVGMWVVVVGAIFIGVAIYHGIARLFGGTGSFLSYAYLLSLVLVPVDAFDAFALLIPVLGYIIVGAVGIYALYLAVLATQAAHHLPVNKAAAVILIPVGASVLLTCALYSTIAVFFLLLIGAAR